MKLMQPKGLGYCLPTQRHEIAWPNPFPLLPVSIVRAGRKPLCGFLVSSQAEGTGRYRMQTREGEGDEQAETELLSLEAVVGPSRPSPRSPATEAYAAGSP